jgi:hypothetical protein
MTKSWTVRAALLALLVLNACGGTGGSDRSVGPAGAPVGYDATRPSVSPVADFMTMTSDPAHSYHAVLQDEIGRCMTAKGWYYPPDPAPEGDTVEPTDPGALVQWRSRNGYRLLPVLRPSEPGTRSAGRRVMDEQSQYLETLSADGRAQFNSDLGTTSDNEAGAPASGCSAEAERRLEGRFPIRNQAIVDEIGRLQVGVRSDPAYVEAGRSWVTCMRSRGFSYNDPKDARHEVSDRFGSMIKAPPGQVTDDLVAWEIRIATNDAECSRDTVWPVAERLERAIVASIIEKYGEAATCGPRCR